MEYTQTFIGELSALDLLHDWLNKILPELVANHDASKSQQEILTAVHEAFSNIVQHAYKDMEPGPIQINVWINNAALFIEMLDNGSTFDSTEIAHPDFSGDSFRGFGWYIINDIASNVTYVKQDNNLNNLLLEFKFDKIVTVNH